jgi:hypothetical protein
MVVEDGTGLTGANSYASESTADSYFDARGNTDWATGTGDKEAALVRATASLDGLYRARFQGKRTHGRDQNLEWPRVQAYLIHGLQHSYYTTALTDAEGNEIASNVIPVEIINACCEMAVRELIEPGSMQPDLDRGGAIKRMVAGSVEIEYGDNATATTAFSLIDGILAPLIGNKPSGLFATAVR